MRIGQQGWVMVGVMSLWAAQVNAAGDSCDVRCLKGLLTQYENLVLQHRPLTLATTPDFRATDNYRPIRPGEGYWQNIAKIDYQLEFVDAVAGQVVGVGLLERDGKEGYFSLRLKVEGRRLSQSEMYVVKKGEATFFEEDPTRRISDLYSAPVPAAQRSTRERLLKLADSFNDAWQYRNEDLTKFASNCDFYENNVKLNTVNGPAGPTCGGMLEYGGKNGIEGQGKAGNAQGARPPGYAADAGGSPMSGPLRAWRDADSTSGLPRLFGTQMWMRDRRYPIVDVRRGVVFGYVVQGGQPAKPGETPVYDSASPTGPGAPGAGAAYMFFLCKIVDGQIVRVDHFERVGGPNVSGGFSDGPKH